MSWGVKEMLAGCGWRRGGGPRQECRRRRWLAGEFWRVGLAVVVFASCLETGCRALELCQVVQNGEQHIAKCQQPSRQADSSCIQTETSTCTKKCPAGERASVECTDICRCEPECDSTCETRCCRLAYLLNPKGCDVHSWDCKYSITFYEFSTCEKSGKCLCGAGYCGYDVGEDKTMKCVEGMGAPCMPCPKGSFKTSSGVQMCTGCADGMSTRHDGSSSESDCIPQCKPGYASVDGFEPCTVCPVGRFQPDAGQTVCMSCSNGTTTDATGTNSSVFCRDIVLDSSAGSMLPSFFTAMLAVFLCMRTSPI